MQVKRACVVALLLFSRSALAQEPPPAPPPPLPQTEPYSPTQPPPAPPPPTPPPPYSPAQPLPSGQPTAPSQPYPPAPPPYPYYPPQQPPPYPYYPPQQPPPAYPPPETSSPPARAKDGNVHSIKLEAGGALRKLEGVGFLGMDYRGSFGAENEDVGHYGHVAFVWGATSEKLRTYGVNAGYSFDARIEFLRLGFGVQLGYLWVRRATLDAHLAAFGAGAFGHMSADLVKLGRRGHNALFVDVRVEGMGYLEDVVFWGPSVTLGFRF